MDTVNKPYSRPSYDRPEPGNSWNSDAENAFRPRYNREGGEGSYAQRPRFNREGGYGQRPAAGGFKKKGGFGDNKYSKKKQIQYREELKDATMQKFYLATKKQRCSFVVLDKLRIFVR